MENIAPADWLQFGAMGLLALVLIFGMVFILKVLKESNRRQDLLIEALQNNSKAMAGLQAAIAAMQAVMLNCQGRQGHVAVPGQEGQAG